MRKWLVFSLLVFCCYSSGAQTSDINLLRYINLHRDKSADGAMVGLSNSVLPVTLAVPAAEALIGYVGRYKKMKIDAKESVEGLAATAIVVYGLKYSINRDRPYVTYPGLQNNENLRDPSFPSAHTAYAFSTATTLSTHYPKWYVIAPSYTWAALVGYSRLHLGMHYPTDVVWGALFGVGSSLVTTEVNKWLVHRKNQELWIEP